jgi:hypothetical protein
VIRRLTLLTALATSATSATAMIPAGASARTYDVKACYDGGPNRSWQAPYDAFTQAWPICVSRTVGMQASNRLDPSPAPVGSRGRLQFIAPAGTRIVRVTGSLMADGTGGWNSGLHDDGAGQWLNCCTTLNTWQPFNVGRGMSSVSALIFCGRASGCDRDDAHAHVALNNVVVTVEDSGAPRVAVKNTGLVGPGWHADRQGLEISRDDPSGIRTTNLSVDGHLFLKNAHSCDDLLPAPCENQSDTLVVDTPAIGDGRHDLGIQTVDGAGNATAVHRTIAVDNHPPATPVRLSVDGGTGWHSGSNFVLRWTPPSHQIAPITRVHVQVCSTGDPPDCEEVPPSGKLTAAAVTVPGPGEWRARVWLEDAAGNADLANAADTLLRMDDRTPTIAFQRASAERPALVRVKAADDRSGLAVREITMRRRGTSTWISLPVVSQLGGFGATIDDEVLPRGIYELRARAVDAAGNERSTDRLSDGTKAEVALPLRLTTTLRVGHRVRVKARGSRGKRRYRIKLVERPQTRFGRTIPLTGRLTSPGNNPLAGVDVQIYEQTKLAAAPWRLIATVRTSRTGHFIFRALRGPSRTLRFRYGGSDTIRGQSAQVRLGVRAAATMRASRHRVVNGDDVRFHGRLLGRPLPNPGKLIELQAFARGRWLTFRTVRANPRTGRWSYTYRFSATRGNVRYRFRARVPRDASYPYESGVSRQVEVRVRGL